MSGQVESTIVDRVAQAIYESGEHPKELEHWSELGEEIREYWRVYGRAALAAVTNDERDGPAETPLDSTKSDGSDLRDRLIDAVTAVSPRFVVSSDGIKVVAEDTVDALMPVIWQHIREIPDKPWRDLDHLAQLIGLRI